MKKILYDLLVKPFFVDDDIEKVITALLWLVILLVSTYSVVILFNLIDSSFRSERETIGVVIEKIHKPPTTTPQLISYGGTTTITPINHPDSWRLRIETEYGSDVVETNRSHFDKLRRGDKISVFYMSGRVFGKFYITRIK